MKKNVYMVRRKTGEKITFNVNENDEFLIGKSSRADFQIRGNDKISRVHLRLKLHNDSCEIEDMDSLNHTYVDGKKVEKTSLVRDGQTIQMADENFDFFMEMFEEEGDEVTVAESLDELYMDLGKLCYESRKKVKGISPEMDFLCSRITVVRKTRGEGRMYSAKRKDTGEEASGGEMPKPERPQSKQEKEKPERSQQKQEKPQSGAKESKKPELKLEPDRAPKPSLPKAEPAEPKQQQLRAVPQPKQPRFCSNCGRPIRPGALFCRECGTPADAD